MGVVKRGFENKRYYALGTRALFVLVFFSVKMLTAQNIQTTIGNTLVDIETAVDSTHFTGNFGNPNQTGPWDLHWGPDDKLWFSNLKLIERYDPITKIVDTIHSITQGNILGITTHGNFQQNPYVYVVIDTGMYYQQSFKADLYKYTYDFSGDTLKTPQYILSWLHSGEHVGARTMYGLDGKIYVSTGDNDSYIDSLYHNSGQILRINPDGSIPTDNPYNSYMYTWGHRNPQGLLQVPNGNIFCSEHAQFGGNDELNLIERNNCYGWKYINDGINLGSYVFDAFDCAVSVDTCNKYFSLVKFPINIGANPPSGIDYYNHTNIPELTGIVESVLWGGMQELPFMV